MIPGGGDPPRPKVQILDFFGYWPNNRYFSRLRRSRKRYPMGIDVLHCIAPQGRKFWSFDQFWARFCIFVMFTMRCKVGEAYNVTESVTALISSLRMILTPESKLATRHILMQPPFKWKFLTLNFGGKVSMGTLGDTLGTLGDTQNLRNFGHRSRNRIISLLATSFTKFRSAGCRFGASGLIFDGRNRQPRKPFFCGITMCCNWLRRDI